MHYDVSVRSSVNSITIPTKGLIKNTSKEKSQFRIKHMSVTPVKYKPTASINGSITLYGHKFR